MKTFVKRLSILFFLVVGIGGVGIAGPGHDHGHGGGHSHGQKMTKNEALALSSSEVRKLIAQKKIPESWSASKPGSATQVGANKDWMIQFSNDSAPKGKTKLFVFISTAGKVLAVNHVGLKKTHSHGDGPAHSH